MSTEPVFGAATERVWGRLPQHFHEYDERSNWYMKRFLSGLLARQDEIVSLISRFEYVSPEDGQGSRTADLVMPDRADASWLPWLSQLFGAKTLLADQNPIVGQYAYIPGSISSLESAAKSALSGEKYVRIQPRRTATGTGGVWDMRITTRNAETLKNIVPEYIATANALGTLFGRFTSQGGAVSSPLSYGVVKSLAPVEDDEWYGGKVALITDMPPEEGAPADSVTVLYEMWTHAFKPSLPGDPFNAHCSLEAAEGSTVTLQYRFMNSGGSIISTISQDFVMTGSKVFCELPQTPVPALTTQGRFFISSSVPFKAGEFGARQEPDEGWVPRSANPIAAIIESGMKPAGVILHHQLYSPTWNDVEAAYPDWNAWEQAGTWDAIEEA